MSAGDKKERRGVLVPRAMTIDANITTQSGSSKMQAASNETFVQGESSDMAHEVAGEHERNVPEPSALSQQRAARYQERLSELLVEMIEDGHCSLCSEHPVSRSGKQFGYFQPLAPDFDVSSVRALKRTDHYKHVRKYHPEALLVLRSGQELPRQESDGDVEPYFGPTESDDEPSAHELFENTLPPAARTPVPVRYHIEEVTSAEILPYFAGVGQYIGVIPNEVLARYLFPFLFIRKRQQPRETDRASTIGQRVSSHSPHASNKRQRKL